MPETINISTLPYFSTTFLLTKPERLFLKHLFATPELEHKFLVCPKVRLADVITCTAANWKLGFGSPIKGKHLDFVLIHPLSSRIAVCIELDDARHRWNRNTKRRDTFIDAHLANARIPLIRQRVQDTYDPTALANTIYTALRAQAKADRADGVYQALSPDERL